MSAPVAIALLGDFQASAASHTAIAEALRHAADHLEIDLEVSWVATPQLEGMDAKLLERFDGIWAAPGTPASVEGALQGIRFARERLWPFVAT